jgi:uncharacterized protein YwqG
MGNNKIIESLIYWGIEYEKVIKYKDRLNAVEKLEKEKFEFLPSDILDIYKKYNKITFKNKLGFNLKTKKPDAVYPEYIILDRFLTFDLMLDTLVEYKDKIPSDLVPVITTENDVILCIRNNVQSSSVLIWDINNRYEEAHGILDYEDNILKASSKLSNFFSELLPKEFLEDKTFMLNSNKNRDIYNEIKSSGLQKHLYSIISRMKERIELNIKIEKEKKIPVGASKFGGKPDLPYDITWPEYKRESMSFLAQINLKAASRYDYSNVLPDSGMLYFFYDKNQEVWGSDLSEYNGWKVIYSEDKNLTRQEFPIDLDNHVRFKPGLLIFERQKSLPGWGLNEYYEIGFNDEEDDRYHGFLEKVCKINEISNHMLGYPEAVQNDVFDECQTVFEDAREEKQFNTIFKEDDLNKKDDDWILLLQLDSNECCNMMWGDVGRLYFVIREKDLVSKNFQRTWLVFQCC